MRKFCTFICVREFCVLSSSDGSICYQYRYIGSCQPPQMLILRCIVMPSFVFEGRFYKSQEQFSPSPIVFLLVAVPDTSVSRERLFSKARQIVSDLRSNLASLHAEQLCFLSRNGLINESRCAVTCNS